MSLVSCIGEWILYHLETLYSYIYLYKNEEIYIPFCVCEYKHVYINTYILITLYIYRAYYKLH